MAEVRHLSVFDFVRAISSADRVLVNFYADWCLPCQSLGRLLAEVADEITEPCIMRLNVDDSPQVAEQYEVRSVPTLIVFQDGQVVDRHRGMADKATILAALRIGGAADDA